MTRSSHWACGDALMHCAHCDKFVHITGKWMHWTISLPEKMNFTPNMMGRKRFDQIKSHLHVRDNNDSIDGDKLFKIRPFFLFLGLGLKGQNALCTDCGTHPPGRALPTKTPIVEESKL